MSALALARTVLRLDVVGSSAGGRGRQVHLDRALEAVLDRAIDAVRDPRYPIAGSFRRADGDSATLVVEAGVAKAWVVADFVLREVLIAVGEENRVANPEHRLRLRVAIDHGEIVVEGQHVGGDPVVATARLVDAPRLRESLADAPDQDLGLIVSDRFHGEVVRRGERGLDQVAFQPVDVPVSGSRLMGWLWVPPGGTRIPRARRDRSAAKSADGVRIMRAGSPDVLLDLVGPDD
ncbi:hypothetical protein [Saccharothrix obliqua]|uniref:hypothetical protein n=1 Tax=Saccharothrix obliqua TaxID=2861747 RepID=UPI001C604B6F|nr:hypothetical protein [Saccharothrix obliqua]MBW4719098.1 hypothetical protein [Saccharothrix obliqua]